MGQVHRGIPQQTPAAQGVLQLVDIRHPPAKMTFWFRAGCFSSNCRYYVATKADKISYGARSNTGGNQARAQSARRGRAPVLLSRNRCRCRRTAPRHDETCNNNCGAWHHSYCCLQSCNIIVWCRHHTYSLIEWRWRGAPYISRQLLFFLAVACAFKSGQDGFKRFFPAFLCQQLSKSKAFFGV